MEEMKFLEIVEAVAGKTMDSSAFNNRICNVTTDSRTVKKGDLFVAICGEHFDGNEFVNSALEQGAGAVLSLREYPDARVITVKDTVKALGDIARFYCRKLNVSIVGITGSSGKTTTKDMVYYALATQKCAYRTEGNYNNEIGLPLTVLKADAKKEAMVLEMGMSAQGEIEYLVSIAQPKVGVITNIGTAHMEQLGSRENIFCAKMEIASEMKKEDVLLVNAEDDFLGKLKKEDYEFTLQKFGFSEDADYRCISYSNVGDSTTIHASIGGEELVYTIPALGKHNILNSLSALAVAHSLELDVQQAAQGLLNFKPSKLRMEVSVHEGVTVINDSYNANPESMKSVLDILEGKEKEKKRIAVLGDMLELGENSERYHFEVGAYAAHKCDVLFAVGESAKFVRKGALEAGMKDETVFAFADKKSAVDCLKEKIKYGDVLLLKGSRGMKMEKVLEMLFGSEEK